MLVAIGIIAVLIGLLLPALTKAREAARRTRCAAQLHQLVAACEIHLDETRHYPDPLYMPATQSVMPVSIQLRLMNDIGRLLRWPEIAPSATVPQLPPLLVCPARAETQLYVDPDPSLGTTIWTTGYAYTAGLEQQPNAGIILPSGHPVPLRGKHRGVVWADSITSVTVAGAVQGHAFYHWKSGAGGVKFDPAFKVSRDTSALAGQHRAWSDGSVEWINGPSISLDPAKLDETAAYRVSFGGGAFVVHYTF